MGPSLTSLAGQQPGATRSLRQRLMRVVGMVRYRFFLYAGLLPYLLGAAWAYAIAGTLDVAMFWSGLGGVVLAVIGVEAFNDYFDSRLGTDRVFNPDESPLVSDGVFWLGVAAFAGALAVGIYLTVRGGWPILAFALAGGAAAIFYEAPPIRWSYRGLGEAVIALAYGPWMVLGSLYLHTREMTWGAFWASLVPGLLIMALAVVNAIPDFHQDRLVGKRNLVVRLGRKRAVWLYLALASAGSAGRGDRRGDGRVSRGVPRRAARAAVARRQRALRNPHVRNAATVRTRHARHGGLLRRGGGPVHRRPAAAGLARLSVMNRIDTLKAPLLVSWQITRDCDLCCLHCCTESAPGKRLPDELDADAAMKVADEIIRNEVPYVMLCGGEPLVVPHFLALAEKLGAAGVQLKIETNGQRFDAEIAARLARLPIRSVQISLDGDSEDVYQRQRPGGSLAKAHAACRAVRDAGLAARGDLRADPAQHRRGAAPSSSGPARSGRSVSIPDG